MAYLKLQDRTVIILLSIFLSIDVSLVASTTHYQQNHVRTMRPSICGAAFESSEEKCGTYSYSKQYIGPLSANAPFKVKYLLYKNPANVDEYQEIFIHNRSSVINANPFPMDQAIWKILVHGYTNDKDSQFPVNVKKAYLEHLKLHPDEPLNLLVYDWGDGAKRDWKSILKPKGVYQNAVENVQPAGEMLGDMIVYLQQEGFLNITSGTHLIGHSLGAHVSGHTARRIYNLTGTIVWRISGLDPAGPLFWRNAMLSWLHEPYPRLQRNRARFLDVYHSSRRYGNPEEMGDVDFYVNGGYEQTRGICPQLTYEGRQQCSHQFAPEIFAKSINNRTMRACTGCYSYDEYHQGICECEDTPILGEYVVLEEIEGYPLASGQAFYDIDRLYG